MFVVTKRDFSEKPVGKVVVRPDAALCQPVGWPVGVIVRDLDNGQT